MKDFLRALSLANLWFLTTWGDLLIDSPRNYFLRAAPSWRAYVVVLINVLLLTAAFWLGITIMRRWGGARGLTLARWSFLLMLALAVKGLHTQLKLPLALAGWASPPGLLIAGLGALALFLFCLIRWFQATIRVLLAGLLILAPVPLLLIGQSGWMLATGRARLVFPDDKPSIIPVATRRKAKSRVVWLLFDELDYRLVFDSRPPTLALPEFYAWRQQGIFATNARPPATSTILAVPALLTGRSVTWAEPLRSDELLIRFGPTEPPVGWSTQPNLFTRAQDAGFSAAVVGWYHPYGRIVGDDLTNCVWQAYNHDEPEEATLAQTMFSQGRTQLRRALNWPRLFYAPAQARVNHLLAYRRFLSDAQRVVTNPAFDLILIHSPVPHPPGIYDRRKDDFSLNTESNYLDNLRLADRTLARLRQAMEQAGVWSQTTVLVSSDHPWRPELWRGRPGWTEAEAALAGQADPRVPFILKLAGPQKPLTQTDSFNTLVTHDLILALLKGEVADANTVADWLKQRRDQP